VAGVLCVVAVLPDAVNAMDGGRRMSQEPCHLIVLSKSTFHGIAPETTGLVYALLPPLLTALT
jgi:hypothetical protein